MDREQEDVQVQKIYPMKDKKSRAELREGGGAKTGAAPRKGVAPKEEGVAPREGTATPPMRRKPLQNKM